MSEELRLALKKDNRAQKFLESSKMVFGLYIVGITIFFIFQFLTINNQIRDSLRVNKENGASNHALTREYIKCIAEILLKPIDQRSPKLFENCGIVDVNGNIIKKDKTTSDTSPQTVTPVAPVVTKNTPAIEQPSIAKRSDVGTSGSGGTPTNEKKTGKPDKTEKPTPPGLVKKMINDVKSIVNGVNRVIQNL